MALFSKQVATEPCGLLVDARVTGWEMWRWWKEAVQHMHLRKTKLRKGCFCLLKPKSILVSRMMFHAPELAPTPQREEGTATAVPVVFLNMLGVKFLSSGFLRGRSWHTPSASCKFNWYW